MKIAMYNLTTTCRFGGVETFVWEISRELARRGEEVHLFGGRGKVLRGIPGVRVRLFPFRPREKFPDWGRRFGKLAERCSMGLRAFSPLAREKFDVIHIHKPFDLPFAWGAKKFNGARLILGSHGTDFFPGDRLFIRGVDGSVACSGYNSRLIAGRYGITPEVIYNGIDPELFRPPAGPDTKLRRDLGLAEDDEVIIYAGRLVGLKGVRVLLHAAASLVRPAVRILIVGEGEDRASLQSLAGRLGLNEKAVFTGFVPHSELPRYYSLARVGVFPTLADEAFGISICEAMACGLPALSTRVGGIPELIADGESGVLVEPGDPEALARGIAGLLENENLRRRLGESAQRRVSGHFTWSKVADRLCAVYRRVLSDR